MSTGTAQERGTAGSGAGWPRVTMHPLPALLSCPPPREGDAVVHLDYGLCRLGPARRLELSDGVVHTIELRFRDGDSLHVPVADAVRVWGYGAELPDGKLDALGTEDWAVGQVQRVRELGESLHTILDERRAREAGQCASVDAEPHLGAAGEGFAHVLTGDQEAALADVVRDLGGGRCSNRLLMGDVGSGKTEVAVRAMLAVALAGQRVRLVAPTRVLARQHTDVVAERAKGLGLSTALYSGDLSEGEKEAVVKAEPDILIGTHGLLGEAFAGVEFGLTVIDEEQKFGAKLKDAGRVAGHTLRLSATPIPKTLAEVRIGLADVSVITEYPAGRGDTVTASLPDTAKTIREAIVAEAGRGGQTIVLCARISELKRVRKRLKRLLPKLKFATAHGQRAGKRNRRALRRFREGKVDVLMATSMLETGLDVASANTMLVWEPERFGLAQLHQLRGRIGRGEWDARFLLVDDGSEDTEGWERRRAVLEAMQGRGDGLRLALADSLQRGSGRVHDDDQSGHASEIGLELFEHLVSRVADGGGADVMDLLGSVPKITGDFDWGLPGGGALEAAFDQTRTALDDPEAVLADGEAGALAVAVAACAVTGAVRLGANGKWVFVMADGSRVEIASGAEAAREWVGKRSGGRRAGKDVAGAGAEVPHLSDAAA